MGEERDREKTMRGLKIQNTAVLSGYQIYHNYFRPHEALKGKTPAEKCGIMIEGENKWKTVIENASRSPPKSVIGDILLNIHRNDPVAVWLPYQRSSIYAFVLLRIC